MNSSEIQSSFDYKSACVLVPRWKRALDVAVILLMLAGCSTVSPTAGVRMNQIQVIGSHNSYHQRAHDSLMKLIAMFKPQAARDLDYGCVWINTHIPLVAEMPHGGFKRSGYGKDLSSYGFEDYTRIKHVMSNIEV